MDDMLSWLRSTIEGDKAAAEAASPVDYDNLDGGEPYHWWYDFEATWVHKGDMAHIQLHEPRNIIARCDAELRLIAFYEDDPVGFSESPPYWAGIRDALAILVQGYRHREGFKPEWLDG